MEYELPPDPGLAPEPPAPVPQDLPVMAAPLPPEAPAPPDRNTGLVIFGILQIILGLLSALMVPFVALGAFLSHLGPGGAMRPGQIIGGILTYTFIAAAMVTLGIGSVQAKRWARALTLVTSWYWLIMGVIITISLTAALPVMMRSAMAQMKQTATDGGPSPQVSTGVMAVIVTLIIIFAAFFLVIVPLAFVIFYGREDVNQTCRRRDPVDRWTDRTPLPVLGASVVLFIGALYLLLTGMTVPVFPFFGKYLSGIGGVACFFVLAALDIYLSTALFRLQSSGWWIAVLTLPIRLLSIVLTYAKADRMQAYAKMGMSDAQVQMLNSNPMLRGNAFLWWSLISMLLFFGYLLWLKRYFVPPATAPAATSPETSPAPLG